MAWKAIITGFDLTAPSITYGYYDDADPLNSPKPEVFLYTSTFRRADIGSDADVRAQVIQTGQRLRQVYNRAQALKAQGAITIP